MNVTCGTGGTGGTRMEDEFVHASPLSAPGCVAEALFLKRHLRRFLTVRAQVLKWLAEDAALA
jgi:hypothetical protein